MSIPPAEEIMQKHLDPHDCLKVSKCYDMTLDAIIEFAKLHVEAALKAASEGQIKKDIYMMTEHGESMNWKESILNSYPLENIK